MNYTEQRRYSLDSSLFAARTSPPCAGWEGSAERAFPRVCPEAALLLAAARVSLDPSAVARIRAAVQQPLDWGLLIEAAEQHFTLPLLYRGLMAVCPGAVPETALQSLRERAQQTALRTLRMAGELRNLLDRFEAEGILAVPYKGAALGASVYGDLALRPFGDLDIFAREVDIPRAMALLEAWGYAPQDVLPEQLANSLKYYHHLNFVHRSHGIHVELHWRFAAHARRFAYPLEPLWERLETTTLLGRPMRTFRLEDQLLPLCVHGAIHAWEDLVWLCDIAEILYRCPDLDWKAQARQAEALSTRRILFLGVWLAHDLLDAPLPPELLAQIHQETEALALARQARERLQTLPPVALTGEERLQFFIRSRERWQDRARILLRALTVPSSEDVARLPLSGSCAILNRFERAARVALRRLSRKSQES